MPAILATLLAFALRLPRNPGFWLNGLSLVLAVVYVTGYWHPTWAAWVFGAANLWKVAEDLLASFARELD